MSSRRRGSLNKMTGMRRDCQDNIYTPQINIQKKKNGRLKNNLFLLFNTPRAIRPHVRHIGLEKEQRRIPSVMPPKGIITVSVIVYLAFQVVLLWTSIWSLYSDNGILRDAQKTADRITQMEVALQAIRSTLKNVIIEKELLKTKYARERRFYHRRMRRQSFELTERMEELEMRCPRLEGNKKCPNGPAADKGGTVGSPSIASVGVLGSPVTNDPVNLPVVGKPGNKTPTSKISGGNVRAGSRKKAKSKRKKTESVYIHWGGNKCRDGAEVVYKGHVAGSDSMLQGGGTNYLCMPRDPHRPLKPPSSSNDRAYLYPVRFGKVTEVLVSSPTRQLDNHDVSCLVCRIQGSLQMMVPGGVYCPLGWKREYAGYLMAQRNGTMTTQYICVDKDSVSNTMASGQNKGHAFLSLVRYKCSDQSCGKYKSRVNHDLSCIVCSVE